MSYGYRLNIEDVFFRLAEEHFEKASQQVRMVRHDSSEGDKDESFRGYPSDEGLAAAAVAIVGWATALEAFTNVAWNNTITQTIPEGTIRDLVVRHLNTHEKLAEVLKSMRVELGSLPWWTGIRDLLRLRNEFVHYKHEVVYQGFCFAPPIARKLSEATVLAARTSMVAGIREVGRLCNLRTSFLDRDYEIATVNE
jgi:hypothetical protein